MRRFRSPRYAPESLERKLNPSGFVPAVAAEVAPLESSGLTTTASTCVEAPTTITIAAAHIESADPPTEPLDPSAPPPTPVPTPTDPWGPTTDPADPSLAYCLV